MQVSTLARSMQLPWRVASLALCAVLLMGWSAVSSAQSARDRVVGPQKGVSEISVFAKPYDASAMARLASRQVAFPLDVLATDGDFLRVNLAGKEIWLDGAEVQVSKAVDYACVADAGKRPKPVASTAGASRGCK